MEPLWSARSSRNITHRVVVEGDLVLSTPAHFGNGDGDEIIDLPLLKDPLDGKSPLLTGASIAGAVRSHLGAVERGYAAPAANAEAAVALFGGVRGDDDGEQSPLIVEDARGRAPGTEFRNGVRIDSKSRTAADKALFNLEAWSAGTSFPLRFELVVRKSDDLDRLKSALASALAGFSDGSIRLGARKRRGYGKAEVAEWRARVYDLTSAEGLCDWLERGANPLTASEAVRVSTDIAKALDIAEPLKDCREWFEIVADFGLEGSSLLVRSTGTGHEPDLVHLHARQPDGLRKPVLPGTSLAGSLRARALKIANTIDHAGIVAPKLVEAMFGTDMRSGTPPRASRLLVDESVVEGARTNLVQNRVSIDRFTGGALDTALFSEQPAFGGQLKMLFRLFNPADHEIGLLLLLLKDLWTGDLPLGGESAVGRGRLKGISATLIDRRNGGDETPDEITVGKTGLSISGNRQRLEGYVTAFKQRLKGGPS